jgi:hypothetical protein
MNLLNIHEYISSEILFEKAPDYCKNSRSGRELIKKKKIIDYIFAKFENGKWSITDGKSKKYDKLFFKKTFIATIYEFDNVVKNIDIDNIQFAPDIIELDECIKFKSIESKTIVIETRGERYIDKIYFKVKDIIKEFDMVSLNKAIIDNNTIFKVGIHYLYFNCKKVKLGKKIIKIKKELFLTYEGILRVLFISNSTKIKLFIKWVNENIFTLNIEIKNQKEELISPILGINSKVVKEVLNTSTNILPCIYLFTLGFVKNLRISMNINDCIADDSIVAKYGFSKDLVRRTGEHIHSYGKIINCDLKLKFHSYIDPQFISSGENDIKNFFNALKVNLNYENNDELVIIPKNLISLVEKQYQLIGKNYMGYISELITKIKELEEKNNILLLNHHIELQFEKHASELKNKDIELKNKDIEILQMLLYS